MDQRLITWGRSVKRGSLPVLWLFTDAGRMPDPLAAAGALPPGICGVVFRHDSAPNRAALGKQLARICRARRIAFVVAGDARLAAGLKAGLHLRGGRRPGALPPPRGRLVTASAHNGAELWRARRAGAEIVFCSPVFPTGSHIGAATLGPFGWLRLARMAGPAKPFALGGIDGRSVRRLGKICAGIAAIEALLSG
jgi:thiamine-phosphate pyrophosphorylase